MNKKRKKIVDRKKKTDINRTKVSEINLVVMMMMTMMLSRFFLFPLLKKLKLLTSLNFIFPVDQI